MGTLGPSGRRALAVATVSRSLALQSPESWRVLRDRGYRLTFAAAPDAWTDSLVTDGDDFRPLRAERSLRPGRLVELATGLRRLSLQQWDLVQVQSPIISVLWRVVATAEARGRTVYVVHGFHFQPGETGLKARVARVIETALAHRTLALATVSAADHAFVAGLPGWLRPDVLVALPGAGVPVAGYDTPDLPAVDAPGTPYALFVGDLNANKDPLCAVDAVAEVRRRGTELGLVVIGEGVLAADLETRAEELPWLRLVERTLEVPSWMARAQVLLAPSRREGVPRVIIEALASGTPVVARHNRGSAELLSGGLGELLTTTDAGAWADAVDRALRSPPTTGTMRSRAEAYDTARFRSVYADLVTRVESAVLDGRIGSVQ